MTGNKQITHIDYQPMYASGNIARTSFQETQFRDSSTKIHISNISANREFASEMGLFTCSLDSNMQCLHGSCVMTHKNEDKYNPISREITGQVVVRGAVELMPFFIFGHSSNLVANNGIANRIISWETIPHCHIDTTPHTNTNSVVSRSSTITISKTIIQREYNLYETFNDPVIAGWMIWNTSGSQKSFSVYSNIQVRNHYEDEPTFDPTR